MFKSYDEEEEELEETVDESEEEVEEIEDKSDEEATEDIEEQPEEEEPEEEISPEVVEEKKKEKSPEVVEEKKEKPQKKSLFKKKDKKEEEKKSVKIYEKGLTKTRQGFVSKLANLTTKYNKVTEEYFEELEEILIMADIGVNTVMDFMDRLRDRVKKENIEDPELLKEIIVDELFIIYVNDEVLSNKINYNENDISVILFIGVNGVGKTTTIAKIANKLKDEGKKVLMGQELLNNFANGAKK